MTIAPSDMICFSLYSATHAMQQAYRPLLDALGITYPQYIVMSALWAADAAPTVGGIGRDVHLDSSTLTPLLKRLETMDLVRRRRDSKDERQVRVELTKAGRDMQDQAKHIPACFFEKTGLTINEVTRLQSEIAGLAQRLRSA